MCRLIGTTLLLLAIQVNAQDDVDGYSNFGRGSCQDQRGKMYSYLQRIMTFPNAETCGKQECERFGNLGAYRGFEFSVAKRCTCLFDVDEIPVVPNEADNPKYVSKVDSGSGSVTAVSGTPGAFCYQFNVSIISTKMRYFLGIFELLTNLYLFSRFYLNQRKSEELWRIYDWRYGRILHGNPTGLSNHLHDALRR